MSDSVRPYGPYAHQAALSKNSPGKNTGVGCHYLPNPGIEPRSPALQADSLPSIVLSEKPKSTYFKTVPLSVTKFYSNVHPILYKLHYLKSYDKISITCILH